MKIKDLKEIIKYKDDDMDVIMQIELDPDNYVASDIAYCGTIKDYQDNTNTLTFVSSRINTKNISNNIGFNSNNIAFKCKDKDGNEVIVVNALNSDHTENIPEDPMQIAIAKNIWSLCKISPEAGNAVMDLIGDEAYQKIMKLQSIDL